MPRAPPSAAQNFLASVVLPVGSLALLPVSMTAVVLCLLQEKLRRLLGPANVGQRSGADEVGCVIISGGRMSKGLTLARAFKRAGWRVIGVEERGWGELCPMRFSSSIDAFELLPPPAESYDAYASALLALALRHSATLFIPVSGAGSSDEDARAARAMYERTAGRCRTFIQDPETMRDLHDKDRFMRLLQRLGVRTPRGKRVEGVEEALEFLTLGREGGGRRPTYVLKCMGLDENRGDMTLFPLLTDCTGPAEKGDPDSDPDLPATRRFLSSLELPITPSCPYVLQEYIAGQEYCTHASAVEGELTAFVCCPSNDMLMTYEDATGTDVGRRAEEWTREVLRRLEGDVVGGAGEEGGGEAEEEEAWEPTQDNTAATAQRFMPRTETKTKRGLTGHFAFDFILSDTDGELYPIECNARCHTAIVMLPLDGIAACYSASRPSDSLSKTPATSSASSAGREPLRPLPGTRPRAWAYNDLVMRLLPRLLPLGLLAWVHPSLPACAPAPSSAPGAVSRPGAGQKATRAGNGAGPRMSPRRPREGLLEIRVEPTLTADDWLPFLVLWHVFWPMMMLRKWVEGRKWTRLNVSTGRIFEA